RDALRRGHPGRRGRHRRGPLLGSIRQVALRREGGPRDPPAPLALDRHHERRGEPRGSAHRGAEERSLPAPSGVPEGEDPPLPAQRTAAVRSAGLRPGQPAQDDRRRICAVGDLRRRVAGSARESPYLWSSSIICSGSCHHFSAEGCLGARIARLAGDRVPAGVTKGAINSLTVYRRPFFITLATWVAFRMSSSGSSVRNARSASLPGSIVPRSFATLNCSAGSLVADWSARQGGK